MAAGPIVISILLIISCRTDAARDSSVCDISTIKPSDQAKPFPDVPDVFFTSISMNLVHNKTTRSLMEVFDAPNSRAVVVETESVGPYKNVTLTGYDIFNFYSNQIVEIIPMPDQFICNAGQLNGRGTDTFIFGEDASSSSGFTAKTAFRIDTGTPPVYQGQKTLETGILTDWWQTCLYLNALDATVTVEYYFSAEDWTSTLGYPVPVMLVVYGKVLKNSPSGGRDIKNVYTFSGFMDYIPDMMSKFFQIPQGTVCPFLKNFRFGNDDKDSHDLPTIAANNYFSFSAELVQKFGDGKALVTSIKESYDGSLNMSRYDFNPGGFTDTADIDSANRPYSEIHDFEIGLAYVIDRIKRNCTVVPLSTAKEFDVFSIDDNFVRMKTVAEFFGIIGNDGSQNWTYTGKRQYRDIEADVYVAEKVGFPSGVGNDVKSIWEIAFSSADTVQVNKNNLAAENVEPMRLYINIPALGREVVYNMYEFDEMEPDFAIYDVSDCYTDDQKREVSFLLPANDKALIESNKKTFYYWILVSITGYLDLTVNRVTQISFQATEDKKNILVRFILLDPPQISGSVKGVSSSYLMPSDKAIELLKSAIDDGKFVVSASGENLDSIIAMTAIKGSLNQKSVQVIEKVVLDKGAAAGIGIALGLVGIILGFVIIFLINRFRGQELPNMSLSFAPKIFQNN